MTNVRMNYCTGIHTCSHYRLCMLSAVNAMYSARNRYDGSVVYAYYIDTTKNNNNSSKLYVIKLGSLIDAILNKWCACV